MNHRFTVQKTLKLSGWAFDEPNMRSGESGTITGWVMAHPTNPIYTVKADNGNEFVCHRERLVEVGALEPMKKVAQ